MALSDIKPDAFTVFTPINFDALVRERFHVTFAFRTNHRTRPFFVEHTLIEGENRGKMPLLRFGQS